MRLPSIVFGLAAHTTLLSDQLLHSFDTPTGGVGSPAPCSPGRRSLCLASPQQWRTAMVPLCVSPSPLCGCPWGGMPCMPGWTPTTPAGPCVPEPHLPGSCSCLLLLAQNCRTIPESVYVTMEMAVLLVSAPAAWDLNTWNLTRFCAWFSCFMVHAPCRSPVLAFQLLAGPSASDALTCMPGLRHRGGLG